MSSGQSGGPSGPIVLLIRDGWGRNPHPDHDPFNAIKRAATPNSDALLAQFPWTLLGTSGRDVGLPDGTMGNSEVGHQNIGAARIVAQDSVRITEAIRSGAFFHNQVLAEAIQASAQSRRPLHLMGIASDAGVHGMLTHLVACLEMSKKLGQSRVAVHLFTDGRDTGPFSGRGYVETIEAQCRLIGVGRIASIVGRYYAMDRDNRWDRIRAAHGLLTGRPETIPRFATAAAAVRDYYDQPTSDHQLGDEFVTPRAIGSDEQFREDRIQGGDQVIFYNYRGDRPRQLIKALTLSDDAWSQVPPSPDSGDRGFDRGPLLAPSVVTMTAYEQGLPVSVAYPKPPRMQNIAGAYLAGQGLTQFRCAETEKFAHVTFFFNDYREEPFEGERRQMAQSPQVATYDLKPQMCALELADIVVERLQSSGTENFILVNFANGDMVGHTGNLKAAIKAVEAVDRGVGCIVKAALACDGKLVVTADHGNAEQMFDPETDSPHTAHTTYDVDCIVVDPQRRSLATGCGETPSPGLRAGGRLADVFPTVLKLMELDKPEEMSGSSLI